jgi:hypothetical protein
MVAWVTTARGTDGCEFGLEDDAAGDTYVNIEQSFDGSYDATTNVDFRQEYDHVAPAISSDRREISVRITDSLYANWDPRCLRADSQGQGTYDPSQPGGGPSYDSLDSAFFDGYGPPGTPTAPKPECNDGVDNDADGSIDLDDPHCTGDATRDDEATYPTIRALTRGAAVKYARKALQGKFGNSYRYGDSRRVACRRVGRLRQRCGVAWSLGDASWEGTVGIWLTREADGVHWNYDMRIVKRVVNCGARGCKTRTRVIRVR